MEYEPGVCNIGVAEMRKRYLIGMVGFILAILILSFELPITSWIMATTLFLSLFVGFEGAYQGYLRFCSGFGLRGVYDMSEAGNDLQHVDDEDAHRKDMFKAVRIHLYAFLSALVLTATVLGYHL